MQLMFLLRSPKQCVCISHDGSMGLTVYIYLLIYPIKIRHSEIGEKKNDIMDPSWVFGNL